MDKHLGAERTTSLPHPLALLPPERMDKFLLKRFEAERLDALSKQWKAAEEAASEWKAKEAAKAADSRIEAKDTSWRHSESRATRTQEEARRSYDATEV